MRTLLALVLMAAVAAPVPTWASDAAAAPASADLPAVPGEYLVEATVEELGALGHPEAIDLGLGWALIEVAALTEEAETDMATQIAGSLGTEVLPNYVYELADEPLFPEQWALENTGQLGGKVDADIDILGAWPWTTGASSVVVAVLDTGVALAHPDLSPNLWVNGDEIGGNGIDDDGNGFIDDVTGWDFVSNDATPDDGHGHGTFVSSIAVGSVNGVGLAGVSPDSALMPVRVCVGPGCNLAAIVAGIVYATSNGADVINLSLSGSGNLALREAVQDAIDSGVTVVAAAGNDSVDLDLQPTYPASYDIGGLISVASTDRNDLLSWFSNHGDPGVDLAAPGEDVTGAIPPNSWTTGSGTSFSTPQVVGVAALLETLRPDLTPAEKEEMILDSVDVLPGLQGKVATSGRLNAGAALELASAPVAIGQVSPSTAILPVTMQFDGTQSYDPVGQIVSWSWKLPDGSTTSTPSVEWSLSKPGTYKTTLTVVDDDGLSDSVVLTFEVNLRPGGTFIDDDAHVGEGAIEAIAAERITTGCNPPANDRYCPNDHVTRGQMAALLARALRLPSTDVDHFVDDDDSVFQAAIDKLAAAGITEGCNPPANDRFCADGIVSRGQMAAFLARAFGLADGVGADVFSDDDDSVFETAIDKLWTAGITAGCNPPVNDNFCPDNPVERGHMAIFLSRGLGLTPFYPPTG